MEESGSIFWARSNAQLDGNRLCLDRLRAHHGSGLRAAGITTGENALAIPDVTRLEDSAKSPVAVTEVADIRVARIAEQENAQSDAAALETEAEKFVPQWVSEAVFYQVFPDRFRNGDLNNDPRRESLEDYSSVPESWALPPGPAIGTPGPTWEQESSQHFYEKGVFDRRYGGDLQGVLDKLDYLEDLGVNAIYFNPVFYARSLHKYDASAMHHIDPYFGPDPAG